MLKLYNKLSKSLVFLLSLTGLICASKALANDELCYPLAIGENGLGSTNFQYLPPMITSGTNYKLYIFMQNVGPKSVNVKLTTHRSDASIYSPYDVDPGGVLSANNSPLNIESGGAILRPGELGYIAIYDQNMSEFFTGKISWQADACLKEALIVTVRNYYLTSYRFDAGIMLINDGKPF